MQTQKIWGVMLVGCGHIGKQHIEEIYYRENIRIVACVDYNEETAKLFSRRYSGGYDAQYGTDYKPFLNRDDLDIVIIATYAETHLEIMRDCVNAGKHVLCEKPIATTIAEAEEFCRIARFFGVVRTWWLEVRKKRYRITGLRRIFADATCVWWLAWWLGAVCA